MIKTDGIWKNGLTYKKNKDGEVPNIEIKEAGWSLQNKLYKVFCRIIAEGQNINIENILGSNGDESKIIPFLANLMSDENLEDIMMQCLVKCTFDGQLINKDLLEAQSGSILPYIVPIKINCFIKNISPFFAFLESE